MSDYPHSSRFSWVLRRVADSRYFEAIRAICRELSRLHANITLSYDDRIAMILAKMASNNPAKAFRLYCEKNPWAAEAKMYDV